MKKLVKIKPQSDDEQRQSAQDISKSFIVSAPAGSGKTTLLVKRFILCLSEVEEPEQVLAITFTRKAAGEMRQRIMDILFTSESDSNFLNPKFAAALSKLRKKAKKRSWLIELNPSRLSIMTIDAFCRLIVESKPFNDGFFISPNVDDSPRYLYQKAARSALSEISAESYESIVKRQLTNFNNRWADLETLLADMLTFRDQYLMQIGIDYDIADFQGSLKKNIEIKLLAVLRLVPKNLFYDKSYLYNHTQKKLHGRAAETLKLGLEIESFKEWKSALSRLIFTKNRELRKKVDKSVGFLTDDPLLKDLKHLWLKVISVVKNDDKLRKALLELLEVPDAHSSRSYKNVSDMTQLMKLAIAHLEIVFAENDTVDFSQYVLAALYSLGNAEELTDVALRMDYKISHILVDEFQDTSPIQLELIKKIISSWSLDGSKSLFLVGDPMQAIYRFRMADDRIFKELMRSKKIGNLHLHPILLTKNFRSQPLLVDWINKVMPIALSIIDNTSNNFVMQFPSSNKPKERPYQFLLFEKNDDQEAIFICNEVKKLIAESRLKDSTQPIEIGIIGRSRTHLAEIIRKLKSERISYETSGLDALVNLPVINDLLALTGILLHKGDRASWFAFLRAPWVGLRLETLQEISSEKLIIVGLKKFWKNRDNKNEVRKRVGQIYELFEYLFSCQKTKKISELVRDTWKILDLNDVYGDELSLHAKQKFIDMIRILEESEKTVTLKFLRDEMNRSFPQKGVDSVVKIMTIHKAKGLEFDYVFLPGMNKSVRGQERSLMYWNEFKEKSNSNVLIGARIDIDSDPVYEYLFSLEKEKIQEEIVRVLYVALTRAKQKVIMTAVVNGNLKKEKKRFAKNTFASLLELSVLASYRGKENANQSPMMRESEEYYLKQIKKISLAKLPNEPANSNINLSVDFDWAGVGAKQIGIVVHSIFQNIDNLGSADDRALQLKNAMHYAKRRLLRFGIKGSKLKESLERVRLALVNVLYTSRGDWLFSAKHSQAENEMPLLVRRDNITVKIIIDRTFVDENGCRWIIDYKTGFHEGSNIEKFLETEFIRHRHQLETYAQAIAETEEKAIMLALYFPLLNYWKEWRYKH